MTLRRYRRPLRLKGYDYSQTGAYFVTVCVQDRACLFGDVIGDEVHLNDAGRLILAEWNQLSVRFPAVELDAFCVMPNHLHGIIAHSISSPSNADVGAGLVPALRVATEAADAPVPGATTRVAPTHPRGNLEIPTVRVKRVLGDIVGAFKSLTTDLYIQRVKQSGWPCFRGRLWQRNYYEHIIRNDESLHRIRQYIADNPAQWASDPENPQAEKSESIATRTQP